MLSFDILHQCLGVVVWFLYFNKLQCELTTTESSLQLCPNISLDCDSLEPGQYPLTISINIYCYFVGISVT